MSSQLPHLQTLTRVKFDFIRVTEGHKLFCFPFKKLWLRYWHMPSIRWWTHLKLSFIAVRVQARGDFQCFPYMSVCTVFSVSLNTAQSHCFLSVQCVLAWMSMWVCMLVYVLYVVCVCVCGISDQHRSIHACVWEIKSMSWVCCEPGFIFLPSSSSSLLYFLPTYTFFSSLSFFYC